MKHSQIEVIFSKLFSPSESPSMFFQAINIQLDIEMSRYSCSKYMRKSVAVKWVSQFEHEWPLFELLASSTPIPLTSFKEHIREPTPIVHVCIRKVSYRYMMHRSMLFPRKYERSVLGSQNCWVRHLQNVNS